MGLEAKQARMALLTLSRPPVIVRPDSEGIGSTLLSKLFFRPAVSSEQADNTSAAAPETWAVAIDDPLKRAWPPPQPLQQPTAPEPPRKTLWRPEIRRWEKVGLLAQPTPRPQNYAYGHSPDKRVRFHYCWQNCPPQRRTTYCGGRLFCSRQKTPGESLRRPSCSKAR